MVTDFRKFPEITALDGGQYGHCLRTKVSHLASLKGVVLSEGLRAPWHDSRLHEHLPAGEFSNSYVLGASPWNPLPSEWEWNRAGRSLKCAFHREQELSISIYKKPGKESQQHG